MDHDDLQDMYREMGPQAGESSEQFLLLIGQRCILGHALFGVMFLAMLMEAFNGSNIIPLQ